MLTTTANGTMIAMFSNLNPPPTTKADRQCVGLQAGGGGSRR
jgi:hypothetical protein